MRKERGGQMRAIGQVKPRGKPSAVPAGEGEVLAWRGGAGVGGGGAAGCAAPGPEVRPPVTARRRPVRGVGGVLSFMASKGMAVLFLVSVAIPATPTGRLRIKLQRAGLFSRNCRGPGAERRGAPL